MVRIKVEYDAYNRSFKLVDRELASALEDGASMNWRFRLPLAIFPGLKSLF